MSPSSSKASRNGKHPISANGFTLEPLPGATFGGLVRFANGDASAAVAAAEAEPDVLPRALYDSLGFVFMPGMQGIADDPSLLVRLSQLFGREVENYHETLAASTSVHEDVPEIFIVSNLPPISKSPPARPEPPLAKDGSLPTQFPHRRDQARAILSPIYCRRWRSRNRSWLERIGNWKCSGHGYKNQLTQARSLLPRLLSWRG